MGTTEIILPDIGGFESVEIIEVHVAVGDILKKEDPIVTLESDKATMDIPSPYDGTLSALHVAVGDKVSEGGVLGSLNVDEKHAAIETPASAPLQQTKNEAPTKAGATDMNTEVLVLGAGPGGYTAAFRAADLGKKVTLVERYDSLGGVCLNVGCIPSKALLHTAAIINEADHMKSNGVDFGKPKIKLDGINGFKNKVVGKLTGGLKQLAKQRKVEVITGVGEFIDANNLLVVTDGKEIRIQFEHCIIAAGSQATKIPSFPNDDERLMDSTDALELSNVPKKLLIVGGGIIGLEMATVYDALGSEITVVEFMDSLIPGCDKDLVRPHNKIVSKRYKAIYLNTKVT